MDGKSTYLTVDFAETYWAQGSRHISVCIAVVLQVSLPNRHGHTSTIPYPILLMHVFVLDSW
jgi:hypothetical protein